MGDELWFSVNKISIDDSNFINSKRTGEYVNCAGKVKFTNGRFAYNYDNVPIGGEDVIFVRNLMTTNEAKKFTREVVSYLDEISNVGGLSDPILLVGFFLSFLFVDPFRKLDLSLQFSRLKSSIIFQEGMTDGKTVEDGSDGNFAAKYSSKLNWHFHLFWWAKQRLPESILDCFFD